MESQPFQIYLSYITYASYSTLVTYVKKETMKNQGVTLLELTVTIAILAIVSAVAAPSFHGLMARNKVE